MGVQKSRIEAYKGAAGGWGALKSCGRHLLRNTTALSGVKSMLKANQPDGFDCPGCAWGDPEHGSSFEFCENGVKAVSWEATGKRVGPDFFARHTVTDLLEWSDFDLEDQGRLTHPMRYNAESDRYEACDWAEAFDVIAAELNALDHPDQALFYTSGRASNEAAFLYQLFGRVFGTNNFPDCSNMCHEASGVALKQSIGVGKGTVLLDDFEKADAIFVFGQNPGTNHPRMLKELREASLRGATVASFNPVRERGLERFADPQDKLEMMRGKSKAISSHYYKPKLGGDMAAVRGMVKAILEWDDAGEKLIDRDFIAAHTQGFDAYLESVRATGWDSITDQSGLTEAEIREAARLYADADSAICTWAMGLTQHKHSVPTIREIVNLLLLRGNIGRPGAGACPVRGHSNVQGDRTVGINEKPPQAFLDSLERVFGFTPPQEHGHDTVTAIEAMLKGEARTFIGLGGNFARATPDTELVEAALKSCSLTVNIATKLNRGHLITGQTSFILPCLGRTELDRRNGVKQIVTVEDSMSMVHGSGGINKPASPHLLSEPAIIAGIAAATVGRDIVDWDYLVEDYDHIRDLIEKTIPGFDGYNVRVRQHRGFYLGNSAAERQWVTDTGKANFSDAALPEKVTHQEVRDRAEKTFTLQTFRSHDQYNTTVYGMDDRYRGVFGERRVLFINPADAEQAGLKKDDRVDLTTVSEDGRDRTARSFRVVPYDIPEGCVASYYPETNILVPLYSRGDVSNTPTSKAVPITLAKSA